MRIFKSYSQTVELDFSDEEIYRHFVEVMTNKMNNIRIHPSKNDESIMFDYYSVNKKQYYGFLKMHPGSDLSENVTKMLSAEQKELIDFVAKLVDMRKFFE